MVIKDEGLLYKGVITNFFAVVSDKNISVTGVVTINKSILKAIIIIKVNDKAINDIKYELFLNISFDAILVI